MTGRATSVSYRQLDRLATRIAVGLAALGVRRDDVVSCQLPNWWQFAAVYLACVRVGAVINPLMPIFRHHELAYMLDFCEARVFICPRAFRGFDHQGLGEQLAREIGSLEHVLAIGGTGAHSFEETLLDRRWEDERDAQALFAGRRRGPDDVTLLMYTSGTTGQPKGVMHTSNTVMLAAQNMIDVMALDGNDSMFMPSPLAHITGFLGGLVMPIIMGGKAVLQDVWDPLVAARRIQDEGATCTIGATPFLADLTHTAGVAAYDLGTLHTFHAGGAPIPRVLVKTAMEHLGVVIQSGWGMTECGTGTITRKSDPVEKAIETDGRPLPGQEVRIADQAGVTLPPDTEGRLLIRPATLFVGYLKRPEAYGLDADGWFDTGDNARMDAEGYIRITGRTKDIIIRGGENIPVVEVEQLLYRHPAIQEVAIVGMPDERLGERGCAFVVLKPGAALSFDEMSAYLREQGVARNYLPERLELVPEMPRTPSGKIQKFRLRETAQTLAG
jgi:cyclohexanecarboxylate-CoA ligase